MSGQEALPMIAEMTPADVASVARLEALVYPQPWSAQLFADELGRDDRRYVTAQAEDGTLLAYGGVLMAIDEAHVTTVVVDPRARGNGIGGRIVLDLLDAALRMGAVAATLEVRATNVAAQRLYRQFGFAPVGVRPRYYADTNEDAIIMWVYDIDGPAFAERMSRRRDALGRPQPTRPHGALV